MKNKEKELFFDIMYDGVIVLFIVTLIEAIIMRFFL